VILFVLDASVAAKWALPQSGEKFTGEALRLLGRFGKGEIEFIVPDLFWAELGNVLWKAVRIGRSSAANAQSAMIEMRQRELVTVSSESLVEQALSIAITFDRTIYDSIYVALAAATSRELLTGDEKLANALAAHFPIKFLGSI
jgi:predicted nucleic acid-binding protein